ncbi:MAG TPA: hypothetical protein VKV40_03060 [Ktedonobacteraceae bacterium]|nr:hypothetical protein [Ktedonobacteraceae bacterium]
MEKVTAFLQTPAARVAVIAAVLALMVGFGGFQFARPLATAHASGGGGCQLNSAKGNIQHVIYIQFDNTHFTRDNPNVPSDLEQMPHLLNFIENNGVMISKQYTPLIAHTATDILSTMTGLYGNDMGVPVANSYRYFNPDGTTDPGVSFTYWTDPIYDYTTSTPSDTKYNMISAAPDVNAPAPWVPFTRAGCNVGAAGIANIDLENIATDIPTVFGPNSPQEQEAQSNPNQANADFVGIAVHCAQTSTLCSSANGGEPDLLPDEPGGYSNYMALYGNKYVAPQISPNGPMTDLNGNVIQSPTGNVGFPGFNGMEATVSLSYVAAMQEHGIPITYAYISDAHDAQPNGPAYGPGQAGYVAALKAYDQAFARFFQRLAKDGINKSNTLFVFSADEGDHFVGGAPSPADCDGVNVPCTYSQIGEINANLTGLLATEQNVTTPFTVHADSAPTIYITGNPARTATVTRTFGQALGKLTAVNPITNQTDNLTNYLADPVEMNILHMVTADPARTPTLTMFANPNYYLYTGAANCSSPCVQEEPEFAWNHGDVAPDINTTWLGLVGPGIRHVGVDSTTWTDHTDVRPTMMALLGLKDDYTHDGRVLYEEFDSWAIPASAHAHMNTLLQMDQVYKQLDADVGEFGLSTLNISTQAIESSSSNDSVYTNLENKLISLGQVRDGYVGQMITMLENAEFNNQPINEQQAQQLISEGQHLLQQVNIMAAQSHH